MSRIEPTKEELRRDRQWNLFTRSEEAIPDDGTTNLILKFKKAHKRKLQSLKSQLRHAETIRFKITYQWRRPGGCRPGTDPRDWKSWREFGSIPILFYSREDAETYLDSVGTFKNMGHLRKVSCCIKKVVLPPKI